MYNERLSGWSLYCFGLWSQLCPAPLSSPFSLVYAVTPNSAKGWELGSPDANPVPVGPLRKILVAVMGLKLQ